MIRFVYQMRLQPSAGGYDMILTYDAAPATERHHGKINDAVKFRRKNRVHPIVGEFRQVRHPHIPVGSLRLVEQRYVFYDVKNGSWGKSPLRISLQNDIAMLNRVLAAIPLTPYRFRHSVHGPG